MSKNMPVGAQDQTPTQGFDVGKRLQAIRKIRGLSQRELARRAGMTNGNLSQIEQGKISPSISTLERIIQAVPMSLSEFFSGDHHSLTPVVHHDQMIHFSRLDVRVEIMNIKLPGQSKSSYMARKWLPVGTSSASEWVDKDVFMAGIVEQGTLCLVLEGHEYPVATGEGFRFAAALSHEYKNPYDEECVLTLSTMPLSADIV